MYFTFTISSIKTSMNSTVVMVVMQCFMRSHNFCALCVCVCVCACVSMSVCLSVCVLCVCLSVPVYVQQKNYFNQTIIVVCD